MTIHKNFSLMDLNTFRINVHSEYFSLFNSIAEIIELMNNPLIEKLEKLVLGGGSNILFIEDFKGIILKNNIKGIEEIEENKDHILIKVGAGEIWQDFVNYCVAKNYGGVENLSLIPGTVGASPIQNIGAYGVEIKDVIEKVEFLDLRNKKLVSFNKEECKFGYRESVFKKELKGNFIITSVIYKLSKNPVFNISYGAIKDVLNNKNIISPNIKVISETVCDIRRSKLPDPSRIGNAGSFFKNPEIPQNKYESLKLNFPEIPSYPTVPGFVKIPAGWLIEKCGWKGKIHGKAGVHQDQALVLINLGGASGAEIKALSELIKDSVRTIFNIALETEVNII